MRDGMPVVALVISIIALVVAFTGLVSRGTSSTEDAPEDAIMEAERRLKSVEERRRAMQRQMDAIAAQAARAIELGSGSSRPSVDPVELERRVGDAVGTALRSALVQEAKRVGAPPPKATVQDNFNAMLKELDGALDFEQRKTAALKSALVRLRATLNQVFNQNEGNIREAKARQARAKTDADLRKILTPVEFDQFNKWRKNNKSNYVKKFFGL